MVLQWNRAWVLANTANTQGRVQLLDAFGTLERLRRSVVMLNLQVHNPAQLMVDDLLAYGATVALEVAPTSPTPTLINDQNVGLKELIWLQREPGRIVQGLNNAILYVAIPGDGSVFSIDTNVQRSGNPTPFGLWLHWRITQNVGANLFNIREAYTYSTLEETV